MKRGEGKRKEYASLSYPRLEDIQAITFHVVFNPKRESTLCAEKNLFISWIGDISLSQKCKSVQSAGSFEHREVGHANSVSNPILIS